MHLVPHASAQFHHWHRHWSGTAPLQGEAADQTNSLFGAAKVSGAAHASSAPPGGYFAREGSLWRRVCGWGSKSLAAAQIPSIWLLHSPALQLGLCARPRQEAAGRGSPGLAGGGGLGRPRGGMQGSALLPLPRKHGNGAQAPWPPLGKAGGR